MAKKIDDEEKKKQDRSQVYENEPQQEETTAPETDDTLEQNVLTGQNNEPESIEPELDTYDPNEVDMDVQDTIKQAEGNFLQKNDLMPMQAEEPVEKPKQHLDIIGLNEITQATETLKKYMQQKKMLDTRVKDNEEWWKLRHWQQMRKGDLRETIQPTSAWLFNSIMNKLADCSDNIPEADMRARTRDDIEEAERLKNLMPMIYESNDYESTYMETCLSKIKNGTGITGIFWNSAKDDIDIEPIDILSIYWQPAIKDIQASRNVFTIELVDNDLLKEMYPDKEIPTGKQVTMTEYLYEDGIDTSEKSAVIDWYYKKQGKLHYCKYCNGVVLLSTENEPDDYPNGFYDDGEYPFVVDTLFKMEGTIAGFGYLDVCKSPQEYIDRVDQAILTNTMMSAYPRYFRKNDSSVNDREFLDWKNPFVTTNSNLGEDDLRAIQVNPINSYIIDAKDEKIQELKQTSGNSDVSTGTSGQGVTAGTAIAQLIETGSKGSRHLIRGTYDAFKKITYKVIERVRQFYDEPRYVRILGDDGSQDFELYDNSGLKMQSYTGITGQEVNRLPMFDIEVSAQKASAYNKMSQNELALQFYQYGFFAPNNADASLACVQMMDFDHKEDVIEKISQNQNLMMMCQQLQQENEQLRVLANLYVPNAHLDVGGQAPNVQETGQQGNGGNGGDISQEDTERALGRTHNTLTEDDGTNSQANQYRRKVADSTEV